jgi:hypothetical protein
MTSVKTHISKGRRKTRVAGTLGFLFPVTTGHHFSVIIERPTNGTCSVDPSSRVSSRSTDMHS